VDRNNNLYLCANDTSTDLLHSTAIPAQFIDDCIKNSYASTFIIILDCCHSGSFKGGDEVIKLEGAGRFVVTSCSSTELSEDASAAGSMSPFTACLIDAIQNGDIQGNQDGRVTMSEVFNFVQDRMRLRKLTPQFRADRKGQEAVISR